MAENDTPDAAPPASTSPVGPARHLRPMRVESQYRGETRNISRQEQEKYGNLLWNLVRLNMGPSVTIHDLVGRNNEGNLGFQDENGLSSNVAYYHKKGDTGELIAVLKFFTAHLMHQARREDDPTKQEFLLYKAADMARMIVQFSPLSANGDAESIVFNIYVALGTDAPGRYANLMEKEEFIYKQMRRLESMPHEIPLRMEVGDALLAQGSYFDALVQYRMLLRLLVRRGSGSNRSRSWVVRRTGELFQQLSDISSSDLRDGRKLNMFIERYNWDYSEGGGEIPRLDSLSSSQVARVRGALLEEANRWHLQAAASPQLERRLRVKIAGKVGENYNELKQYTKSLKVLEDCYPLWEGVEVTKSSLEEQLHYLDQAYKAAVQLKNQGKAGWASRESSNTNSKMAELNKAERDREAAKAAMMA